MKKNLRSPILSQSVSNFIKDYIVVNNLKAGDPLPSEGQLAKELNVSRSPVREAVKSLESLGIIDARHGGGLYVREWNFDPVLETLKHGIRISPQTLAELYQIRVWLEVAAIGDAIKSITASEITDLEILMLRWARAIENGEPYVQYDEEFHNIIYGALKNQTLVKLFKVFWLAFEAYGGGEKMAEKPERVLQEHQEIFKALKDRDADTARTKLLVQFGDFKRRIEENMARSKEKNIANNGM
jgi:DNA-binding FadR family transcriptional regulator